MRRSNRMPVPRNRLRTALDYRRAQIMLAELDGKITPQEADALRAVEREDCARTAEAMAIHPHNANTAQAVAANIRARR